jgi:hypothetical protein
MRRSIATLTPSVSVAFGMRIGVLVGISTTVLQPIRHQCVRAG